MRNEPAGERDWARWVEPGESESPVKPVHWHHHSRFQEQLLVASGCAFGTSHIELGCAGFLHIEYPASAESMVQMGEHVDHAEMGPPNRYHGDRLPNRWTHPQRNSALRVAWVHWTLSVAREAQQHPLTQVGVFVRERSQPQPLRYCAECPFGRYSCLRDW